MYSRLMPTVLLLLTWNTARLSDATSRVVGGHSAPREYGRYHVSLQNVNGQHVCGGVVISKKHLVTAAHCIYQAQPKYINAIVGTTNLDVGGKHYNISSITTHADYDHYYRLNDIAILTIKGLFDLNYVDILNLYEKELVEGDIVTLSGFGAQEPNGASSRIMYSLTLPVFNQDTCSYAMRYSSRNVTDRMFCTFSRIGQGPCHGDSGGPLVRHQRLVGLVSWGMPCAVGFPDVHTRITPYIDWIRKQTKYANCHITKKRK